MKTILAIDPSLTNTAVILGDGSEPLKMRCFQSKPFGAMVFDRNCRYQGLIGALVAWLDGREVDAVYIEGYSFGSKGSGVTSICEYGGLLRNALLDLSLRVKEVAPSCLKKFATGKGNAPKEQVIAHLTKRYGVLFDTNDEYDAYGIYRMALIAEGIEEAQNQAQREAVDTVLGRGTPKRKKKAS